MQTPIGARLHESPRLLWTATALSVGIVAADLALVVDQRWRWSGFGWHQLTELRLTLAIVACLAFAILASRIGDGGAFGFRPAPRQGWRYWALAALVIGLVLAGALLLYAGVAFGLLGYDAPTHAYVHSASDILPLFLTMCVVAPLLEEPLYRLAVVPTAAAWLGPRGAIALGGALFAGLHFGYGNPSPENVVGGFLLTWAYLKSGTLVVPMALHALGNFCVVLAHVGHYSWRLWGL